MQQVALPEAPPAKAAARARERLTLWWRGWRTSVIPAAIAFAAFRVVTEVAGLIATFGVHFSHLVRAQPQLALSIWDRFDAAFYIDIAHDGYRKHSYLNTGGHYLHPDASVFPPLFPAAERAVQTVLHIPTIPAATLIVAVALFAALVGLHRLVRIDFGQRTANLSLALMLAFPVAFFFAALYTEALLLAFIVWAFLAARSGRWWIASALAGAAALTKVDAAIVVVPLGIEYMAARGWSLRRALPGGLVVLAGPAVALGALMLYMGLRLGDPLRFITAEAAWRHSAAPPWIAITTAVQTVGDATAYDNGALDVLELVSVGLLLLAAVYSWFRVRRSYALFLGLAFLAFTCGTLLQSAARYSLVIFPLFVAGAVLLQRRLVIAGVVIAASAAAGYLFLWDFMNNVFAG